MWLRTHADIPLTVYDYQYYALITTVYTAQLYGSIARQTFQGKSILVFLPLSNPHLNSIVWSLPPSVTQERLTVSAEAFNATLAMNFNLELVLCKL